MKAHSGACAREIKKTAHLVVATMRPNRYQLIAIADASVKPVP
jgi:hypothetical protein